MGCAAELSISSLTAAKSSCSLLGAPWSSPFACFLVLVSSEGLLERLSCSKACVRLEDMGKMALDDSFDLNELFFGLLL